MENPSGHTNDCSLVSSIKNAQNWRLSVAVNTRFNDQYCSTLSYCFLWRVIFPLYCESGRSCLFVAKILHTTSNSLPRPRKCFLSSHLYFRLHNIRQLWHITRNKCTSFLSSFSWHVVFLFYFFIVLITMASCVRYCFLTGKTWEGKKIKHIFLVFFIFLFPFSHLILPGLSEKRIISSPLAFFFP